MLRIDLGEDLARLPDCINRLREGEVLVLRDRNRPVAELRKVAAARSQPRPIGLAKSELSVPPSFFEPLPDDSITEFDGGERDDG